MRLALPFAIAIALLCLMSADMANDDDVRADRLWKCVANGQVVWKPFCARYWTELFGADDEEDDDT